MQIFNQKLDDRSSLKRLKRSDNDLKLPENFEIGRAIADGSCFFDSFRQGLKQQLGVEVTVKQLWQYCKEFAQNNPPEWFINAIANSHDNNGEVCKETLSEYIENILNNDRWGDPEVEGRILCIKYEVTLHVIEINQLQATDNQQEQFLHQLVSSTGAVNAGEHNEVNYNDDHVIHIINKGHSHFEPVLRQGLKQRLSDNKLTEKQLVDSISENTNEERPQDFELIELLIEEADIEVGASTLIQQKEDFKSFQARFQSFVDQIPSYLHSVEKAGFFSHFSLGSFFTLLDTKIAEKLDIKKIYFSFDGAKTLKVAIIKNGEIKGQKDVVDKVRLFVI